MNDAGHLVRDPAARRDGTHPIGEDAVAIAHNVRSGAVAPIEVVESFQARIEALNPLLNAIVDYDPAEGQRQAADVGRRLAQGEFLPLAGVPVVVKDVLWVAGSRITQGSNLFRDFKPPRDALCVERLRAAGAIILGIGNSSEFACKGRFRECVDVNGLGGRCASIRMLDEPFASLASVQEEKEEELIALANRAVSEDDADVVILAGAPLAGLAARVRHRIPVPLVEQTIAAVRQAETLVALSPIKTRGTFRRPSAKSSTGLASSLATRIAHQDG
jgi:amidase/Asp/Glu/hydantoin racemase